MQKSCKSLNFYYMFIFMLYEVLFLLFHIYVIYFITYLLHFFMYIISCFFLNFAIYFYFNIRYDTHVTSMEIVHFSRPPPPLSIYVQTSSTLLTLNVQFQTNRPLSSNDNLSIKRKLNPRMTVISYQVAPSVRFSFSVSTH